MLKIDILEPSLKIALQAVQEAGDMIGSNFQNLQDSDIQAKGKNDFVTRVDREAEAIIKRIILNEFPHHQVLGEEGGYTQRKSKTLWVIDPLDGTTNFIQGIPHFAISMALMINGKVVLGLIYDPLSEERFHAIKGQGAFLNNRRIAVSRKKTLRSALGATGFPFKAPQFSEAYASTFRNLLLRCQDMRRCGSAALDLAYTACGRYDFFWEAHLLPWDFMAGKLIIDEAGGRSSDFQGKELKVQTSSVLVANQSLYSKILKILASHFKQVS
ncbi:MAG: inositol monophosphatase [Candidatus Aminicenantes bacterium]|nr:inositol monophosphatase [Candidatus Aminicenantes bacterium]